MNLSRRVAWAFAFLGVSIAGAAGSARADERGDSFLDPPYPGLAQQHPIRPFLTESKLGGETRSDVSRLIAEQTPVQAQGARGTCSIFSATAIFESMLIIRGVGKPDLKLSEEWLEYLIARKQYEGAGRIAEGSGSPANFSALLASGAPKLELLPYVGEEWAKLDDSALSQERCEQAGSQARLLKACLLGHFDPRMERLTRSSDELYDANFAAAAADAEGLLKKLAPLKNLEAARAGFHVETTEEAKALLRQGIPLTLDFDFYYGAWNHRLAPSIGVERDMDAWDAGRVGYPERGSVDRARSPSQPAAHSIVIVGYDDNAEIVTHQLMEDGSTKDFTYKGVYYFKNSWGTVNFGVDFALDGVGHPGYGMITQKYAEDFGAFYKL